MDITNQIKALPPTNLNSSGSATITNSQKIVGPTTVAIENAQVANVETQEKSEAVLVSAVNNINDYIQNVQRSLQFTIDEESGKDVVTVLDKETEEVIRQFPSEEVLAIARQLADNKDGDVFLLFNSKA